MYFIFIWCCFVYMYMKYISFLHNMQKSSLIEFELDCNFAFREVSVNMFATLEEVLPTAGLKFYGIQKGVDSQWFLRKTGNMALTMWYYLLAFTHVLKTGETGILPSPIWDNTRLASYFLPWCFLFGVAHFPSLCFNATLDTGESFRTWTMPCWTSLWGAKFTIEGSKTNILLIEEIAHHLRCIKLYK